MKRTVTLLLIALALVSGLTQCKKNVETLATGNLGETVHIKVNVDNGSKYEIYPGTGAVVYTAGDKIFVGDGSKYLGTLTYASGAFSGDITKPSAGVYLHFYFASGLATTPAALTAGTTSYTVNIASQGTKLPVLSYGKSTSTYTDENATYGCTLLNKCALVNVTLTEGTDATVTVAGMKTTATIDFATPGITPAAATGDITLYSESGTSKWVILLPQDAVDHATVTIGGADYTVDVPEITANGYLAGANALAIENDYVFSVSSTKTVHFSPGNLQYKAGEGWRFAEHQYDVIGSWNTSDWVDLFGWGTWGSGQNPLNQSDNNNDYQWSSDFQGTLDGNSDWFTLSNDQWQYILDHSTYGMATVNSVYGIVILPDGSSLTVDTAHDGWDNNTYTAEAWAADMESQGAVFLPAAGYRNGSDVFYVGGYGYYWSSSPNNWNDAWFLLFYKNGAGMSNGYHRRWGQSVRLVR